MNKKAVLISIDGMRPVTAVFGIATDNEWKGHAVYHAK